MSAATQLSEISALAHNFFEPIDGAKPVTFEEFDTLSENGDVILVDVLPASEFEAGHVEGAINIPLDDLETRLSERPRNQNVVAYCRGPYCVMAALAVAQLRDKARKAARLDAGSPEWRHAGRAIEA